MCQGRRVTERRTTMLVSQTNVNRPGPHGPKVRDLAGVCILVLDDDSNMRSLVRGTLASHGCQNVLQTGDAGAALRLFATKTIDLVICDWIMEPMSGLEFLRELRRPERGIRTPVIMLSGVSDPRDMLLAQPFRIGGWLIKPISSMALIERVFAVLELPEKSLTLDKDLHAEVVQVAARYRAKVTDDLGEIEQMLKLLATRAALPELPNAVLEIKDGRRVMTSRAADPNEELRRSWRTIERIVHGIKGQAGSFGFDLITSIAELGQVLMRSLNGDMHAVHRNGRELHKYLSTLVQSIRLVLEKEIRGDGGVVGQRLMDRLRLYSDQVRAGMIVPPAPDDP
jgi:two-component system, chemotaxis family, chemotaxis protein CheY